MSERKLANWVEAGLIDDATATRIRAYEEDHARPLALWAVIGVGVLAIGLGLVSIVAANWEDVPGMVRLAIHLFLLAGLAGFVAWRGDDLEARQPWALEAALFVIAVLGITFFGHIGQVYQTDSPLWKPLAAALILFGPLLLLRGQSWIAALLVMVTLIGTVWEYTATQNRWLWDNRDDVPYLWLTTLTALPVLVGPAAAWLRGRSIREAFWIRIEQLALIYAVAGTSLLCVAASNGGADQGLFSFGAQSIRAAIGLLAAGLVALSRPTPSGNATALVLVACAVAAPLSYAFANTEVLAGLLFMALWVAIAAAALFAGWRGVFQAAVAAVALRLIILSFELASDLLTSGFGLIFAGALILAVAWVAVKVSREFAPPKDDHTEPAS